MLRVLASVSDKTGLVELAVQLKARFDCMILSTGGTAKALKAAKVTVMPVSAFTNVPEVMGGRVKTIHPKIAGGILARRHVSSDMAELENKLHSAEIGVVVVNLYPFVAAAMKPETTVDGLIEEIDIGGPSLVRAAAKNFKDVLVVVDPDDYQEVLRQLAREGGPTLEFRLHLAQKAFAHTADYDSAISGELDGMSVDGGELVRTPPSTDRMPNYSTLHLRKRQVLRYGENPHQQAAWYTLRGSGGINLLQGKELSFTNILDVHAAVRIAAEFEEPSACVVKHTNPCGAAVGRTIVQAYTVARDVDALSAFGGIVGLNRPLDAETAREIVTTFIECVVAPEVSDEARSILASKPNMRVVVSQDKGLMDLRTALGGFLQQERDRVRDDDESAFKVVTKREPSEWEWLALRFAWRICAHVKSNSVIFTGNDRTAAIGAGQTSRVDSVEVAVMKAVRQFEGKKDKDRENFDSNRPLAGSACASDAFFPFRDGLDAAAKAGATAVIQPGGSVRDGEVIAAADEHNIAMVFTGRRHFQH